MKVLSRILLVLALCASFWPAAALADEMPLESKVAPGTSFLTYQGQTFRITTSAPVKVVFERVSPSLIQISFIGTSSPGEISVYWINFAKRIFDGQVPLVVPFQTNLNTEGGFIDR
jgi:hypothetical protein